MQDNTVTAAMSAVQQILQGLDLDTAMIVLGSVTTMTIVNNTATDDVAEDIAEKFIDVFAHTLGDMLETKGSADAGH